MRILYYINTYAHIYIYIHIHTCICILYLSSQDSGKQQDTLKESEAHMFKQSQASASP